jgi:hypothetical protein
MIVYKILKVIALLSIGAFFTLVAGTYSLIEIILQYGK